MSPSDEQIRQAIADQASEWFVENRGGPLDRETRTRFMSWLRTSPVHVEEYLAVAGLVRDLDTASRISQIPLEPLLGRARAETSRMVTPDPSMRGHAQVATRPRVARVWTLAAALAFLALTLWVTRDGERLGLPRTYRTAHGEQSERVLPDGSVMHLNTDSQVTVHYSRRERVVELDRGEVLFTVTHRVERGFRVAAGNAHILDVGTKFDVYRTPDAVRVTVIEGTVAVHVRSPSLAPDVPLPPTVVRLGGGYQVEVRGQVGLPRPVDAHAAIAWLKRQIAFDNEPLGEVAEEFNRYGHIPIEIDDEALRALPITGVFDAYDTESFVAFLAVLNNVVVEHTANRIRILNRAAAPRERRSDGH